MFRECEVMRRAKAPAPKWFSCAFVFFFQNGHCHWHIFVLLFWFLIFGALPILPAEKSPLKRPQLQWGQKSPQKSWPMGANTTWHCCYTQQFSRSKKLLVTFFCWSFFVAVYSSTVSILQRCFWRWSLKMVILSPLSLLFKEEALEWSEAWVMRDEGAEEGL